jgi:hypothetical protein
VKVGVKLCWLELDWEEGGKLMITHCLYKKGMSAVRCLMVPAITVPFVASKLLGHLRDFASQARD